MILGMLTGSYTPTTRRRPYRRTVIRPVGRGNIFFTLPASRGRTWLVIRLVFDMQIPADVAFIVATFMPLDFSWN